METKFLNAAGTVLFTRDDMEQGSWSVEQYTVNATFPYVTGKVIERGQRMVFRDPATNGLEVFEVRNVNNIEPEHYQQIIAEHIAVSELSDDHCNSQEIDDKTALQALTTVLSGTLWSAGNSSVSGTQSADIARGSVWQAVGTIEKNWNAYIVPRITFNSAGAITGRYLDIIPAQGTWRGVRLSIDKNMQDSSVVYDDTNVITAMYGYGGNVEVENQSGLNDTEELTFKDEVWTATSEHPAKPANQTYIEYPEKTALYGRNGRPRYGYYQNSDIDDAAVLLQKTWETLKETCDPEISISGTVADLYRLGYADQPLRLHDTVIVEVRQTGEKFEKEIIALEVDLIDPTATRPTIGDYVPNIVYINRATEETASGGGGGGGRGQNNEEKKIYDTYYDLSANTDELGSWISMVVGKRNGDLFIKAGEITLAINSSTGESTATINADHVNISATNTAFMLAGALHTDADGKLIIDNAGGVYVERTVSGTTAQFGVWDSGNLTGLTVATLVNGDSSATINASKIYLLGETIANTITADYINGKIATIPTLSGIAASFTGNVSASGIIARDGIYINGRDLSNPVRYVQVTGPDSNNLYTLRVTQLDGTYANYTFERGDTDAAYNQGWNDCIDAASGSIVLSGYTTYASGRSVELFLANGTSAGTHVWRYGGITGRKYTLPAPRS